MPRPVIIDECLPKRLAAQLRGRGRSASAVSDMGLQGVLDQPLLEAIAAQWPDHVLVTTDDNMPADHRETLRRTRVTVAIVDPQRPPGVEEKHWEYDVVHRWIHQIGEQSPGTIRRYAEKSRPWTDRRGRRRRTMRGPRRTPPGATGTLFPE